MATILVVDDDAPMRRVLRRALAEGGHEVVEAENGRLGVEAARRSKPDLVITDINMPDQEGIQTIMELREIDAELPIIVISGEPERGAYSPLHDARLIGADISFAKPFALPALLAAVERLIERGAKG